MNLCCFNCNSSDDDDNQGLLDPNQPPPLSSASVSDNVMLNVDVINSSSVPTPGCGGGGSTEADDELAKILQETAAAMIDVSASGTSHASLDQREFQERTRAYLHKLQSLGHIGNGITAGGSGGSLPSSSTLICESNKIGLLADVPNPEKILNGPLISDEDLNLMNWAIGEISSALSNIRVEAEEELVVPFGV